MMAPMTTTTWRCENRNDYFAGVVKTEEDKEEEKKEEEQKKFLFVPQKRSKGAFCRN